MTLTKSFRHLTAGLLAIALSAVFVLSAVGPAEIQMAQAAPLVA